MYLLLLILFTIMVLACQVLLQGHVISGVCDFELPSSRIIMNLICHVIFQDHLIKGLCDYMDGSPS